MAWSYCGYCGNGMDQITVDEIGEALESNRRVTCRHCRKDRYDDTHDERMRVMVNAILDLKKNCT